MRNKPLAVFILCLAVMVAAMVTAAMVQTDFGRIEILSGSLDTVDNGRIAYKLYRPLAATAQNPAPAVLLMHGYQNDKDTSAAYALELARRGVVALAIDSYGHGGTSVGLLARGFTHHKLPNWEKPISGPDRFLLMMNFNTCDFFTNLSGVPGGSLGDTSMGGRTMYAYLGSLPYVDSARLGISGHSMGTWSSWSVASSFPDHKAIVLQCGEVFPQSYYDTSAISFNNVLLLQARYDEFSCFLDYTKSVPDELVKSALRYRDFANQNAPIKWDTTYGSFADGSARRMELIKNANHRLVTINTRSIATAMDWFFDSFGLKPPIDSYNQTALVLQTLQFAAFVAALASTLPLLLMLLKTRFFVSCAQSVPGGGGSLLSNKKWWNAALVTMLIGALTYPFLTQLGHGLVPLPESIFRMTIGNGVITWFVFLTVVAILMLRHWYKKSRKNQSGISLYDLGLASENEPDRLPWGVIGKSLLLAFILVSSVYIYTEVFKRLFSLDLRFVWPLLKPFTPERFVQFFVYLPFYLAFFLVNGGVKLYGQMRQRELKSPALTQLVWWLKSSLVMVGSLLLVCLVEYIPFFAGVGPGMDLLFSSTFGGPFISFLIVLIPQFTLFFFISTYAFRKTGRVYVGSTMLALFATWAITAGSSIL